MAKKFNALRATISPKRRQRNKTQADRMLLELAQLESKRNSTPKN